MKVPVAILAAIGLLAGCEPGPVAPALLTDSGTPLLRQAGLATTVNSELAALRRATASFHDAGTAASAGWSAAITGCMSEGEAGAMGFHFANGALIDGLAEVESPELLLYEPTRDGDLRLVGVEYIIPYNFHPRDAAPPVLFAQEFRQVDAFGLWGLHVWVWAENPEGMFAPWNPSVTCDFAASPSASVPH